MAIESIRLTTVFVADQDAALNFYVNTLGMEKKQDDTFGPGIRLLVVGPKGNESGIVLQAVDKHDPNAMRMGGFTGIVFGTSDVNATYTDLKARGVYFLEKPLKQEWGATQAVFSDLSGNLFILQDS